MRNDLNVTSNEHIQAVSLNRRIITKEKLVKWLETACYILHMYLILSVYRYRKNAVPILERIEELENENSEDQ